MFVTSSKFVPDGFRVKNVEVTFPMGLVTASHILWPFALNPWFLSFSVSKDPHAPLTRAVLDPIASWTMHRHRISRRVIDFRMNDRSIDPDGYSLPSPTCPADTASRHASRSLASPAHRHHVDS